MGDVNIQELVDRYVTVSFFVTKKAEALIRDQIDEELTNDQHYTLRQIYKVGRCTSSELADKFGVKKSAITAIINRLYKKGLIQRTQDENDRRMVYLSLTDKGNELYKQAEEKIHHLVAAIITQFEQTEIEAFIDTYEKLLTVLDQEETRK